MINKNDLINRKLKQEYVKIDGGEVLIREFTTADREKFETMAIASSKGTSNAGIKAKLLMMSMINEDGSRFFGDDEASLINSLPSGIVEVIFNAILKINGMAGDELELQAGN